MSDQTLAQEAHQEHEAQTDHEGRGHPSDRSYVGIALILAVLTALDVVSFYVEDELGALLIPALVIMMIVKFVIVVAWFMHLRFDSNLFTRVFVSGLLLAIAVYAGTLTTFRFW